MINKVTMPGGIEAVIFDLDGTLIDTETLAAEAIQKVVEPFGKIVEWGLQKKLLGLRGPEWSNILVDELDIRHLIKPDDLIVQWEAKLQDMMESIELMPGVHDLITACTHLSLEMAIATSSNSNSALKKIAMHPIIQRNISIIVCGDDPAVKMGKPNPDIYLVAASRLGIEPAQCLAFEDSLAGVISATSAGLPCIACPDPRLDKATFFKHSEYVISSLKDFDVKRWIHS